MEKTLQLEIPVILPGVKDESDQCVQRLIERLQHHRGIHQVHVKKTNGEAQLCLHYDPNLISLEKVRRLARDTGAEISNRFHHETLQISGMDCADCALSIEHTLKRQPGILAVSVSYAAEKMRVEYDASKISHKDIVRFVNNLGYRVVEETPATWVQRNLELMLSLASGVFLAVGYFGEKAGLLSATPALVLYILAYLTGGYDATRHGLKAALKLRFDIDFLMVIAALGAAFLGEWEDGALLLFLFSLGHALEHYAMDRARNAIKALSQLTPRTAFVKRDGKLEEVPVEALQKGDVVVVRPGERIPIDGEVVAGHSAVDESPITGESIPVEKEKDSPVFAGTINGDGTLEVKVTRLAQDTTLARVIQLVEEAQTQKSPTQVFTERFERVFVPVVLIGVVVLIFLPPLVGWLSWSAAFLRAITVLVAASPCALAIATPSAILSGIARAARAGVLIKGGVHLENLGALRAIAFDKTGTITVGKPEVVKLIPLNQESETEVLRLAAALESGSQHPLAEAVVAYARQQQVEFPVPQDVQSIAGKGITGRVAGKRVEIGNGRMFRGELPPEVETAEAKLRQEGVTTMLVRVEGRFIGIIGLADQPRPDAAPALAQLKRLGIEHLVMLTGDNPQVAQAIAKRVGITEVHASLLPEQKVDAVKQLLEKYGKVAMVGDGVNDAPALATATVGIAMGASGTDVALETADIALMADDLSKLPFAVGLSRQGRRIIQQNLAVALGVIGLLVTATLAGATTIGIAILFHEGSTLVVVANALRLLRYKSKLKD